MEGDIAEVMAIVGPMRAGGVTPYALLSAVRIVQPVSRLGATAPVCSSLLASNPMLFCGLSTQCVSNLIQVKDPERARMRRIKS